MSEIHETGCRNCGEDRSPNLVLCEACMSYNQSQNYCGLMDRHSCDAHASGWRTEGIIILAKSEWEELNRRLDEPPKVIPGLVKLLRAVKSGGA